MITSIFMKNCATYPVAGATIENCQKINFFYGPNGSGKSTISNYLQNQSAPQYSECKITWDNVGPVDTIVYNKEFRARHFKENIAGVFTLGQATIEEINELNVMKAERAKKAEDYSTRNNSLMKKQEEEDSYKNSFKDTVWNIILKENESDFQNAFSGFRANKEKFRDQVLDRFKKSHSSTETREELKKRADTLFESKPERCLPFHLDIDSLQAALRSVLEDEIWHKVIVGNKDVPIAKLIEVFDNANWVNKGRQYISHQVCPFCQKKTITADFEQQLNLFFSGEYETDIRKIKELMAYYERITKQLLNELDSISENTLGIKISGLDEVKFNSLKTALNAIISSTITEMNSKLGDAGKKISLPDNLSIAEELKDMIISSNKTIETHNQMVDNYNVERAKLTDDIWTFLMDEQEALISGYLKDIEKLEKAKIGIRKGIDICKKQLDEIDEKIIISGKNITSVQPAVDEINCSLKAYGFTNFKIVPSPEQKNSYQIQRLDGTLATNTLSEGEETFISFLYFLQFAKGAEDISKISSRKVLVLDDPICSLDSTVLYIVSSMVKSLIKDIRNGTSDVEQLFILTHNVFFHKEASFIDGRTHILNDVNYWIISKDNNITSIRPYEKNNPIKTSYELLWQELRNNKNTSLVTVQNIMRRILENYFSILGKSVDDDIVNSFEAPEEKMICRSLISWINDGSHSIPDDLYIDSYADSVDRYKDIFRAIFVQMGHKAHYDMMMT